MQEVEGYEVDDEYVVDLADTSNIDVSKAVIELTHRNNLFRTNSVIGDRVPESHELSTREWQEVIDRLAGNGVEELVISGGEPTVREDFHDILGYAINVVGDVEVITNGNTSVPLSTYDCSVQVRIDSMDPSFNNRVFRSTDPDNFEIDSRNGRLIDTRGGDCKFCGKYIKNHNGARLHLKNNHQHEAIDMFNDGVEDSTVSKVDDWDELGDKIGGLDEFNWTLYLDSVKSLDEENALSRAVNKIERLDQDDLSIRSTIYEENNIELIMTFAESKGVDTVFVPLRPSGQAGENYEHQVPTPGRMKEAMGKIIDIDSVLSTDHTLDSPIYLAYKYKRARQMLVDNKDSQVDVKADYELETELQRFWGRGRVTDVGVSKLCVSADGTLMPAPYIRKEKYRFGNILDLDWDEVKEGLADFNSTIIEDDRFARPAINTDIRRKSVACDYGVALNYGYES
jgi:MoaA/NifB/PqqE/SkfB family radical SAM enzyme